MQLTDNWPGNVLLSLLLMIMITSIHHNGQAQFLRLQLVVEDEIAISRSDRMDLGMIRPNQGWVQVNVMDDFAGRLTLRTTENNNVIVNIRASEELIMDGFNRMPFLFEAAYVNDGSNDPRNAIPITNNQAAFPINNNGLLAENMANHRQQLQLTLLFYGSIYAGEIEPGVYSGNVLVTIEYE